jgi:hypothetical protein
MNHLNTVLRMTKDGFTGKDFVDMQSQSKS